jgi:hypothetical protein
MCYVDNKENIIVFYVFSSNIGTNYKRYILSLYIIYLRCEYILVHNSLGKCPNTTNAIIICWCREYFKIHAYNILILPLDR